MQNIFLVMSTWISRRTFALLVYINDIPFFNSSKAPMLADELVNWKDQDWGMAQSVFLLVCTRYKAAELTFRLKIKMGEDSIQQVKASKSLGI